MENEPIMSSTSAPNEPNNNNNNNNNTVAIINISLQTIIAFVGIVGNILVCIVILRKPKMKSVMNFYLLSLAVSDLGILAINFPIAAMRVFAGKWLLGSVGCVFVFPTSDMFFGASIWSIKAIAIERYRNIVGSSRFNRERSMKPVKIIIPLIWAASFMVTSVPMFIVIEYNHEKRSCVLGWPEGEGWHIVYFVALSVLYYVVPLLVVVYTYARISRTLQQSQAFQRSSMHHEELDAAPHKGRQGHSFLRQSSRARRRHHNNKAKRILTPLVVLFAVTMLPLSALRIGQFLWGNTISGEMKLDFFTVAIYGVIINSSMNPVIYCIVSRDFRQGFEEIFKSICTKQKAFRQRSLTSSRSSKTPLQEHVTNPPRQVVSMEIESAV